MVGEEEQVLREDAVRERPLPWKVGLIGTEGRLIESVWPQVDDQSFVCHDMGQEGPLQADRLTYLGSPARQKKNFLRTHPDLDVLLITQSGEQGKWDSWVEAIPKAEHRPRVVLICDPVDELILESKGLRKDRRKTMHRLGYEHRVWRLGGHQFGGAIHQERCVSVYFQDREGTYGDMPKPCPSQLPARSMSNLLMPTGIPRRAWIRGNWKAVTPPIERGGVQVVGTWKTHVEVVDVEGCMPDHMPSLVATEKGVRYLQYAELGKAKGWEGRKLDDQGLSTAVRKGIRFGTGIHILTAMLDAIGVWLHRGRKNEHKVSHESGFSRESKVKRETGGSTSPLKTRKEAKASDWNWTVPALEEGGKWYQDRMETLRQAVAGWPDSERWLDRGKCDLANHRLNYTEKGPQRLQLLWWEFPREHWQALREGSSMNFLVEPSGELVLNSPMDAVELEAAGRFVDELIKLGVIQKAEEELVANCPLFTVDKPAQPGEKRCIADCKSGGQNACMGKDPVYLVQKETILPQLYSGGYSAIADASKQFHNFLTVPSERKFLGCIHPISGCRLWYVGLPMGTANSPAIACRINNGALRLLRNQEPVFQGKLVHNTWGGYLRDHVYDPTLGHGRVEVSEDGEPAALIWAMVDDYLIHASSKEKCGEAFSVFMDHMVKLGFICQKVKTKAPAQVQKFCGMLLDTTGTPCIRIPSDKVSRAKATIELVQDLNREGRLSRLAAAVMAGLLQSLVEGTSQRQGQTYLRHLYDDIHHTDAEGSGRALYFSYLKLSERTLDDLTWWMLFLDEGQPNFSPAGSMDHVWITWGDGSGTGTGGTIEAVQGGQGMHTWMGAWNARSRKIFSSNWKELRTLLLTLERLFRDQVPPSHKKTVFYFTDNLVTYYIVHNGSSSAPGLHNLIRKIKLWEISHHCRLEVIHVPGRLMIHQGTDGLSRGLWVAPERLLRTSVEEAALVLDAVPWSPARLRWVLTTVGLSPHTAVQQETDSSDWNPNTWLGRWSVWFISPELGRAAITKFLDLWVEQPLDTGGIFVIPRVLQKQWGFLCRHVQEFGVFYPLELPGDVAFTCLIPFCILLVSPHHRRLDPPAARMESRAIPGRSWREHLEQAEWVRGLR